MNRPYSKMLSHGSVTLSQDEDSGGRGTDFLGQEIKIETGDAGDGPYIVLQTDRWALDEEDIEQFCSYLHGFIDHVKANWYDREKA